VNFRRFSAKNGSRNISTQIWTFFSLGWQHSGGKNPPVGKNPRISKQCVKLSGKKNMITCYHDNMITLS
jgi:hypothetical protein